ncbi:MAG: TolC family protein [Verrucomicrobiia bacterium]|jgi:outer membrane protein TolC
MKHFGILSVFFAVVAAVMVVRAEDNPAQAAARAALSQDTTEQNTNAQTPPATNPPVVPLATNAAPIPVETNGAPALAETNAIPVQMETSAAPALIETNTNTRAMSLQDCIQEALQHNLDVQIQRYNPQISLYDLHAAYSGYDPTLSASGQHNYNVSGSVFQNGFVLPGSISDENSFKSGIGGTLPMGLQYDFSGNINQQYGTLNPGATNASPFESSGGSIQVQLTQPLLKNFWIDTTRLNIRVAKNRLKFSEQGLRQQIITSVTAVENAYYELIYALENVTVQQEALELAQTQLDQDNQRVQIGTLAVLSVQQDESQVAQSQANLIAAQFTLVTDQNTLKSLLADTNYFQWHDMDIQPKETLTAPVQIYNLQDSWRKGMTERPDLLEAQLNVEQQGIQLKFYRNQIFPELDLTGTYGYNGSGTQFSDEFNQFNEGNRPFYSYGAQMTVPFSNVGPRNQYKATKATLQQITLQLKQFEQNVLVEIDNAVKQAQSNYQSVEATKQARIYAEAALDAEQKTYAVGKATTFEVLQYQNSLTAARSAEIRALANYNEALSNLAAQEGSTIERNNISIEAK